MYGHCSKLVSLLAQASVFVQAKRHFEICPFFVISESVMFYDTGPGLIFASKNGRGSTEVTAV
jgi:hypothetical protein